MTEHEQQRRIEWLEDENRRISLDMMAIQAEAAKWRGAARVLCSAHVGKILDGCPVCRLERARASSSKTIPQIVCLCGSMSFAESFAKKEKDLTAEGLIVVKPCMSIQSHPQDPEEWRKLKIRLDELHLCKIDLADFVYVINVAGYVGDSTRREIGYAISTNKPIRWLEPKEGEEWLRTNPDVGEIL